MLILFAHLVSGMDINFSKRFGCYECCTSISNRGVCLIAGSSSIAGIAGSHILHIYWIYSTQVLHNCKATRYCSSLLTYRCGGLFRVASFFDSNARFARMLEKRLQKNAIFKKFRSGNPSLVLIFTRSARVCVRKLDRSAAHFRWTVLRYICTYYCTSTRSTLLWYVWYR